MAFVKQADSFAALPKTMHFRVWKMSITSRVAILFLLLVILPMAGTAWMIEEGWLLQDLAKRKSPRPEWLIALSDTLRKMNEKRRPGLSWLIDLASIFMELGKNKDLKAVLAPVKAGRSSGAGRSALPLRGALAQSAAAGIGPHSASGIGEPAARERRLFISPRNGRRKIRRTAAIIEKG